MARDSAAAPEHPF